MADDPDVDDTEVVSYERWGVDFFVEAVSRERILSAVNTITGQPIDFGPIGVGPGRIAKVRAYGEIGAAAAERLDAAEISYRVELPVDLTFELDLQVETHTFHAQLLVPLTLTARALAGVRVQVDITPPRASEVRVQVRAEGLRASIMQRVANVEGELRRFVARYVARELTKPHVQSARTIDVAAAIDRAWSAMAPSSPRTAVAEDLNEALESEIRENEDTFLEM